ncbi:hypothetical protein F4821DRAFT_273694 [Hypoxylon rubiginosum]|uniref:Uncharacterized protein n=1 Tax=Hypoxylon rubiginosum TaxID=110542 RepID=A0ACC0CJR6_9PEZI|nr:hypothetical protein F4821DRAFT_273694 [Hypoxylon rubiginosum]
MGESKNESSKSASQAWRKKPRKFAPKSRLGCKTCKIRRVKCDLSWPSCQKCQSTGRTCDGYNENALSLITEIDTNHHKEATNRAESYGRYNHCITISTHQPETWYEKHHGLVSGNLDPFMILPVAGQAQGEAMCFFEYISIKHLNEHRPCESWRKTLMFFSQTVPSVRHAAIALSLVYRNYLSRDSMHQPQPLDDGLPDNAAMLHYNRAIHLLLNQESGDNTETTAVTLLVCYLFTCYDHLAGNYVQAMKHLRGGVELSRNIDEATFSNNQSTYDDAQSLGSRALIHQVTKQIRRLDTQAVTFLIDWTPRDIQETLRSQLPLGGAFPSLDQAADHLQILVARVMRLHNTEQQMSLTDETPPPPTPSLKDILLGQLEIWSSLFETMLQESGGSYVADFETYRLVSLLRLQHTIAWILVSSYGPGPGREMEYDNYLPQFQQCVALAGDVAAAHEQYSGSLQPTFTPEVGIVPVLYIIGVKCRHPVVRRQVLSILRRQSIREAIWDSISAARVVERVIQIEEGGSEEEGGMTRSMEQIVVWQRIETMSWVQSAVRLDISYTFCGLEGTHIESLMI